MTYKHTVSLPFLFLRLSSAAILTVLAGSAGHAQSILLTAPPTQPGTATTVAYPVGSLDPNDAGDPHYSTVDFIYAPFTVAAGSTNVTFTATKATPLKSFESFTNDGSFDFPVGTQLVDTAVGDNDTTGSTPTGPLLINFNGGVSAFGLNAQDTAFDSETFTFTVFTNGSTTNGTTFVLPTADNTVDPSGKSVFLGAQAVGSAAITSVLISSQSLAVNEQGMTSTAGSNDFYFGPLAATPAAVPETSTVVSFGLLMALGGGLAAIRKNQKERKTT